FSVTQQTGVAPFLVGFTDQSKGATSPRWDFGDGQRGEGSRIEHQYDKPGVYTAALGVDTPTGPKVVIRTITVLAPLTVSLAASTTSGPAPLTVTFTDRSVGDTSTRQWELGDGTVSSEPEVKHTYAASGTYTVKLTVSGPAGTYSAVQPIVVSSC